MKIKNSDKFPALDLIQVYQNKQVIYTIAGKEFSHKTKKELAEHLGDKFGQCKLQLVAHTITGEIYRAPLQTIVYRSDKPIAAAVARQDPDNDLIKDLINVFKDEARSVKDENKLLKDALIKIASEKEEEKEESVMDVLKNFLPLLLNKPQLTAKLADPVAAAENSSIPPEVLELLNKVDWQKATPFISELLTKYGSLIPMKK